MDLKVYRTYSYMIYGLGTETDHRKVELLSNAVHQVAQKMIAVDGTDADSYRIQTCALIFEINCDDGVSMLRSKADRCLAVSLMHLDGTVGILESDHFISWKGMAVRTSDET